MATNRTLFCSAGLMRGASMLRHVHFRIHIHRGVSNEDLDRMGLLTTAVMAMPEDQTWVFETTDHPKFERIYTREFLVGTTEAPANALTLRENECFALTMPRLFMKTLIQLLTL